jgi:hypothetical protein
MIPIEGKKDALERPAFYFCELQRATENCALLGYYAACSGNSLPMFWDNLSVPPSRVFFILDP